MKLEVIAFVIFLLFWAVGLYIIWIRPRKSAKKEELTEEDLINDNDWIPSRDHIAAIHEVKTACKELDEVNAANEEFYDILKEFKKFVFQRDWSLDSFKFYFDVSKSGTPHLFKVHDKVQEKLRNVFESQGYAVELKEIEDRWEDIVVIYRYNISLAESDAGLEKN